MGATVGATQIHHVMVGVLQGAPVHIPCSHLLFVSQVDHINYIWVGIDILNRMTGCCRPVAQSPGCRNAELVTKYC